MRLHHHGISAGSTTKNRARDSQTLTVEYTDIRIRYTFRLISMTVGTYSTSVLLYLYSTDLLDDSRDYSSTTPSFYIRCRLGFESLLASSTSFKTLCLPLFPSSFSVLDESWYLECLRYKPPTLLFTLSFSRPSPILTSPLPARPLLMRSTAPLIP
jgi:hypothetical protein